MHGIRATSQLSSYALKRYTNCRIQLVRAQQRHYSYAKNPAYCQRPGHEPLVYRNIGQQLQRAVERYGKRTAVISAYEGQRLTFEQLQQEATSLAVKLKELDLQCGEHLGVWAPNSIQWYITLLAAAQGGYPLVCLNPALQAREVEYALRKAKVKTLITLEHSGKQNHAEILKTLLPQSTPGAVIATQKFPELRTIIMKSSKKSGAFLDYDHLLSSSTNSQDIDYLHYKMPQISPETPYCILFTSGTTGQPKAAQLTHFGLVNESRAFGRYMKMHEGHKHVCLTVPLFHVFALGVALAALEYGSTVVIPSASFNSHAVLEAVEREGCNILLGTPTMYVDMVQQQLKLKKALHTLDVALVGAASCSPEVFAQVKRVIGVKEMLIAYGSTETSCAIFAQDGTEPNETAMHTVGRLFEHGEAKLINNKGETVTFGESGELCVRGYFTMRGYFEDEQKTREVLDADGWLKTGDTFILEPSGTGRIIGRNNDVIIRGGENIYPKEVEDFLDTHEDILEAQIVGVPDDRMGEELCAYLRLKPGAAKLNAAVIKEFCKGNIAHFKVPRYVHVVDEFPKTSTGKIQKFRLQEMFVKNTNKK